MEFFDEGTEIACFESPEELVDKSRYYLANEAARQRIADAGYRRCVSENSLIHRADRIVREFQDSDAAG